MCGSTKTPRGSHQSYLAYIMDMLAVETQDQRKRREHFEILNSPPGESPVLYTFFFRNKKCSCVHSGASPRNFIALGP